MAYSRRTEIRSGKSQNGNTGKNILKKDNTSSKSAIQGSMLPKKEVLLRYLPVLASRPHLVEKEVNGRLSNVKEYFITDIIEYMHDDGLSVGYILAEHEEEVMGVDDLAALTRAQKIYESGLMPKDMNNN